MLLEVVSLVYLLSSGVKCAYDVDVSFEGYLPILGGRNGKASVVMQVEVNGLPAATNGNARATSEIKSLQLSFNKAVMPFGPESVQEFFPKTTIELTRFGHMVKTDAPDVKLPVRLPGLDVKRFPDITYLPLEFPELGIELGKSFNFKKPFGEASVNYTVTPTKIEGDTVHLTIKLDQKYSLFEDVHHNDVATTDAAFRIDTSLEGEGSAEFDKKHGVVTNLEVKANAVSQVTNLSSNAITVRRLETGLKVQLKSSVRQ